jgi:hypothetical protein
MMLTDRSTSEAPRRIYDPSLATSFLAVSGRRFSRGRSTAAATFTPSAPARSGSSACPPLGGALLRAPDPPGEDAEGCHPAHSARIQIP